MVEMTNLSAAHELWKNILDVATLLQKRYEYTFLPSYKPLSANIYVYSFIYSSFKNSFISDVFPHL